MQAQQQQEAVYQNETAPQAKMSLDAQFEDLVEPPTIDMQVFLERGGENSDNWELECQKVAYSFHKFGICIVRDPRVNHNDNNNYIDMVERYFESISDDYYAGGELADMRPELSFQTGVTPESMEKARDHHALANRLPEADKPLTMYP